MATNESDIMVLHERLQEQLYEHQEQLQEHIEHCEQRFSEGQRMMEELIKCTRTNTKAVNKLAEETAGMVKVYNDVSGAVRLGVTVQKIGMWVVKWPLIGAGIYAIWKWISANIGTGQ